MLKNKKNLTLIVLLLIIIIAGVSLTLIKGINYGLIYGENINIQMYINQKVELADIKSIVTDVFGNKNNVKQINHLNQFIDITVKTASEEELNTLVSKINEKYELEITRDDLEIINNPKIKGIDLVFPYIMPVLITSIISLIYFIVRYRKIGILKILLYTIITIIGTQLIYLSIYSITRIPVNQLTMPISMAIFVLSLVLLSEAYESNDNNSKKTQK